MPDHITILFAETTKIQATSLTRFALLKYMVYTRRAIEATMQLDGPISPIMVKIRLLGRKGEEGGSYKIPRPKIPMIPTFFAGLICRRQTKNVGSERMLTSKRMSVTLDITYIIG